VSDDTVVASAQPHTFRSGWGWLLLSTLSRFYLVLVAALVACALLPMFLGLSGAVIQSSSMEPHVHAGDVVLSRPLPPKAPLPLGRVITFRAPPGSAHHGDVLHRLVAVNANGSLVTKGDANTRPDSTPLARRDIISQACLLIPWVGLPSFWVGTGTFLPLGVWVLLTVVALMVGATDAAAKQPPQPRAPPEDLGSSSGTDPDAEPLAAPVALPGAHSTPPRATSTPSILSRIFHVSGARSVGVIALLTVTALALAPLGMAGAAFTSKTFAAGNSWATSGPATKLAFTTSPSGSTDGIAFPTQPVVTVQDTGGNTVALSSAPVALSITTAAGANLTCTANPITAVGGVATFAGCTIDKAGIYTLTAASSGLTSAVSASFTISAGSATKLAFSTNPSGSPGGIAFGTQPVVTVQDAGSYTVVASTASVALSITTPAGANLTCTANPKNAAAGVATFAGCKIDTAGTYTLTAVSSGLTSAVTTRFIITTGSAAQLAFTTSPSSSTGGTAFTTQPVLTVQDTGGNTITSSAAPVTLSITTPAGATLACSANPVAAVSGVATFASCKIDKAGTYTLTAASSGLTSAVSAVFTVATGPASKLIFYTNPSASSAGGTMFAAQPVLTLQDAGGNTVTSSTAPVTLSITTPAGATLICSVNPVNAVAGMATFAGCSIDKAGTYTLTAASSGLTSAISASLTISTGAAVKVAFTTSPSGSTGGTAFGTQPVVTVLDAGGNTVTGSSAPVTLNITTAAGATLLCSVNPVPAVSGVASFTGCAIDKAGTYTLTTASSGLTSAVSASLSITVGSAAKVAFTTDPSSSTGATTFATQPVVTVQDAGGNTITGSAAPVTLSITTAAGSTLTCSANSVAAVSGVATFAGCQIDKAGTYTLTAASSGLTSAVSASLSITVGSAAKVTFTTNPSSSAGGTTFATQPVVTVQDAGGNTVTTSTAPVALAITTAGGATLTCTANPTSAVSGVTTFAGCAIDKAGTYTLTATSGALTAALSNSLTITVGSATKLGFTTSPASSPAGTAFGTQPVVSVQDGGGNTVTGSAASVTLTITTAGGATLTCSANPVNASSGVATFAGCSINKTGTYTLTATSSGLTSAVSTSLTITPGAATKLIFTTSPSNSTGGIAFTTQPVVTVQDGAGNTVTTSTAPVTLSITGATLACAVNPNNAVSGAATFAGCNIDKAGTYTLTATSSGLTSAVSAGVTITVGAAAKLGFTTQPSKGVINTNFGTQPVVAVQDAGGNTVTTSSASVTLTITTPAGATLSCSSNSKNASSGVASFSSCKINTAGSYTLTAAASGLTSALSLGFTIAGTATKLAFTTSPSGSTTSSTSFTPQPVVTVQDASGYTVTNSSTSVTLTITTPAGATLTCSSNPKNASSGLATFSSCKIDKAGTYTLTAAASGLASAVSTSFTITAGSASKLAFTTSPSNSTAATAFTTQPVVIVQDAAGNTVTTSAASVTLSITGATLVCTANPTSAISGVATFAGCSVNKTGTYTLTTASTGLTSATSTSFTITAGSATMLAFTTSPSNSSAGGVFGTQPVVTVQDAGANTVTTSTASVTLTLTTPAGATLTCTANPSTASSGVATFAGCSINTVGTYTLTAASNGLTNAVSANFTITAAATKLAFTTSPSNSNAGSAFGTQPVVTVQDAGGVTVTTSTASVMLTITTPAGATLTCSTNPKNAVAGVDSYTGCSINTAGTYTLTAASSGLTNATSSSFTINGGG
jgi:signal peptidase I